MHKGQKHTGHLRLLACSVGASPALQRDSVVPLPQSHARCLCPVSEHGQAFRHALSCSVLALLVIPDGEWCEAEFGSEFGGLYPVAVRFTPKAASLRSIEWYLSSAGQEYLYW
ncbi:conjugation system SOS inhibitor PsiB family protein [Salmonella enterica subsp. enterica serovar Braenderup]